MGYVALLFVLKDVVGKRDDLEGSPMDGRTSNTVFAIFALLIAANLLSTVLERGAGQREDNPVHYLMIK